MNRPTAFRRFAAAGLAAAFSLLLSACLITPGKFDAALDLRKDGRFTYSYKGEIFVLGLSELMKAANAAEAADAKFEPVPCYTDDTMEKERPCSKDELAKQEADWRDERMDAANRQNKDLEMAKALLGGLDPTDPRAAEELAVRLRRQYGWTSVVYKGNGVYVVDFRISGTLTHDFAFPTMEKMPQIAPFFIINRRNDGTVRVDTPGLSGEPNGMGTGFGNLGQMLAAEKASRGGDKSLPGIPQIDGRFVLTTDGLILANNTDEGPKADPAGKRLEWVITPRETAGPMALIELAK